MAGNKEGGVKAAKTNKEKYGPDFYANIGREGGKLGKTGGFYGNPELARKAGAKGGRTSRKGVKTSVPTLTVEQPKKNVFSKLKEIF